MFPTLLEDRGRLAALRESHTGPLLSARGFKQYDARELSLAIAVVGTACSSIPPCTSPLWPSAS